MWFVHGEHLPWPNRKGDYRPSGSGRSRAWGLRAELSARFGDGEGYARDGRGCRRCPARLLLPPPPPPPPPWRCESRERTYYVIRMNPITMGVAVVTEARSAAADPPGAVRGPSRPRNARARRQAVPCSPEHRRHRTFTTTGMQCGTLPTECPNLKSDKIGKKSVKKIKTRFVVPRASRY
jgi:hypothetical protein